jgi:hypothetical protein
MKLKETLRSIIREEVVKVLTENTLSEITTPADVKKAFADGAEVLKKHNIKWNGRYINKTQGGFWVKFWRAYDASTSSNYGAPFTPISNSLARKIQNELDKIMPPGYRYLVFDDEIMFYTPNMKTGEPIKTMGNTHKRKNG